MPHRITTAIDIGAVLSAHATAIVISMTDLTEGIKVTSFLLAIGYTCWKWKTEYKIHAKKKKK